jgi:hypothetical protein
VTARLGQRHCDESICYGQIERATATDPARPRPRARPAASSFTPAEERPGEVRQGAKATVVFVGRNHRAGAGLWIVGDQRAVPQWKSQRHDPRIELPDNAPLANGQALTGQWRKCRPVDGSLSPAPLVYQRRFAALNAAARRCSPAISSWCPDGPWFTRRPWPAGQAAGVKPQRPFGSSPITSRLRSGSRTVNIDTG